MRSKRMLIAVVAVVLVAVIFWQAQQAGDEGPSQAPTVVAAKTDIAIATELSEELLEERPAKPEEEADPAVMEGAVRTLRFVFESREGSYNKKALHKGAVLMKDNLGKPTHKIITPEGMVLMNISGEKSELLIDHIEPGHRVNVMASVKVGLGGNSRTAIIEWGVKVGAVNGVTEADPEELKKVREEGIGGGDHIVTLIVMPKQAENIRGADIAGELSLVLQTTHPAGKTSTHFSKLLAEKEETKKTEKEAPPPPPRRRVVRRSKPPAPPEPVIIEAIRGDTIGRDMFIDGQRVPAGASGVPSAPSGASGAGPPWERSRAPGRPGDSDDRWDPETRPPQGGEPQGGGRDSQDDPELDE